MGLFDKIKDQALNGLNVLQDKVNNIQNQQSVAPPPVPQSKTTPPPVPQSKMTPPPASQSHNSEGIYGNYMEHLINMALADGVLTEKEKQVLFKKAEANGIDLDEFEMVLDARLYERQKAIQGSAPTAQSSAPKSEKYGDVRKCPSCGAILESFITRCPDCGHDFTNVGVVSSFTLLSAKLEALDCQKNHKYHIIMGNYHDEQINFKKASLIRGFPVPTTKEDILEFISMSAPLAMPAARKRVIFGSDSITDGEYDIAKAWRSKCEQVIIKARFSMKDDKASLAKLENYAIQLKIK